MSSTSMAKAPDGAAARKRSGDPLPAVIIQRARVGGGAATSSGGGGGAAATAGSAAGAAGRPAELRTLLDLLHPRLSKVLANLGAVSADQKPGVMELLQTVPIQGGHFGEPHEVVSFLDIMLRSAPDGIFIKDGAAGRFASRLEQPAADDGAATAPLFSEAERRDVADGMAGLLNDPHSGVASADLDPLNLLRALPADIRRLVLCSWIRPDAFTMSEMGEAVRHAVNSMQHLSSKDKIMFAQGHMETLYQAADGRGPQPVLRSCAGQSRISQSPRERVR